MSEAQQNQYIFEFDDNFQGVSGYSTPGWYFWNEIQTELIGPFKTMERAEIALNVYSTNLNSNL